MVAGTQEKNSVRRGYDRSPTRCHAREEKRKGEEETDVRDPLAEGEKERESVTGGVGMSAAQRGRADRWAGLPKREGAGKEREEKGKFPRKVSFLFFF